jgi:hypothetical protein
LFSTTDDVLVSKLGDDERFLLEEAPGGCTPENMQRMEEIALDMRTRKSQVRIYYRGSEMDGPG